MESAVKRIKKSMKLANKFGQKFTVKSVEFACIILSNGEHIPKAVAYSDYSIVEES